MIKYRTTYYNLMTTVKADYSKASELSSEDQLILIDYAKRGKLAVDIWAYITVLYTASSVLIPLLIMGYYYMFDEFKFITTIIITLPPAFDQVNSFFKYFFMAILTDYLIIFSDLTYVSTVPQGLIYMLHACGRIDILKRKVLSLFSAENPDQLHVHRSMRVIAKELQDIYEFVGFINTFSKLFYEVTLAMSSVVFPISAILILEGLKQGSLKIDLVNLTIGVFALVGIPCYYGNLLVDKSMELREAVYFCNWERVWNRSARTSLIILMTRMERAICIHSVFQVLNLEALADVSTNTRRGRAIIPKSVLQENI
ncbi:hypothetical protein O0L34_g13480 [Tuta absoluta]|nr:hypothetical protein O0L34_g13480 [Tuta absoluta]